MVLCDRERCCCTKPVARSWNRTTIEYNSILAETGREREAVIAAIKCIRATNITWDELIVSGIEAGAFEAWHAAVRTQLGG